MHRQFSLPGPRFELTATFAAQAGKTRLTWRRLFDSVAECEKVTRYAVEAQLAKMTGKAGA